jgi:hypothetical protein
MPSTLPEVERETIRRTQPFYPGRNWDSEYVSNDTRSQRSAYQRLDRRALTEIQRKVVRRGKRATVLRSILSKDDKEKIAGWKQDLVRILQVFNVRFIGFAGNS